MFRFYAKTELGPGKGVGQGQRWPAGQGRTGRDGQLELRKNLFHFPGVQAGFVS